MPAARTSRCSCAHSYHHLPLVITITLLASIRTVDAIRPTVPPPTAPPPPTQSNFLLAATRGSGRGRNYPSCSREPAVCLDREKNPSGGATTCCFHRFCKDTMSDADHCGECGRRCGLGDACCGGRCVDVRGGDPRHCGGCYLVCPDGVACEFGMCGYDGAGL